MIAQINIPTPADVANDDYLFSKHLLKIQDDRNRVIPFEYNTIQRAISNRRGLRNIVIKPRQRGVTTYIQGRKFRLVTTGACRSATVADTDQNTLKIRRISNRFYDTLPQDFRPIRGEASASMVTYPLCQSEDQTMTAGSSTGGRAGTVTFFHGSEVAFWKNADDVLTAFLGAIPVHGEIWLESTPNGAQGKFHEMVMRAHDGDPMYTLHFFRWFDEPDLRISLDEPDEIVPTDEEKELMRKHGLDLEQIKWRRFRVTQDPIKFLQEFPEDLFTCFFISGQSVFGDVSKALYTPDENNPLKPVEKHRYVAGIDWGLDPDYTAISIIDGTDDIEVHLDRYNKSTWETMRGELIEACIYWGVETIQAESNSMGGVNIEDLKKECWAKGYYPTVRAKATTNKRKTVWVSNLYKGIHEGGLQLLKKDYATRELHAFTQSQTDLGEYRYKASGTEHDDTVIARLLAWDAVNNLIG